jgi:hypothetical protein
MTIQKPVTIVCPQDNKDDAIQKIPALVQGGIASGTFSGPSGGVTYVDGKRAYTSGYNSLSGNLTSNIAQMLSAPPLPNAKADFWFYAGWWTLFYFSLAIIIGPFLLWSSYKKDEIAHDPDYPRRYALWQKAMSKWNRSYYCHRCGIVFDPETNKSCTPQMFIKFLYEQ